MLRGWRTWIVPTYMALTLTVALVSAVMGWRV